MRRGWIFDHVERFDNATRQRAGLRPSGGVNPISQVFSAGYGLQRMQNRPAVTMTLRHKIVKKVEAPRRHANVDA